MEIAPTYQIPWKPIVSKSQQRHQCQEMAEDFLSAVLNAISWCVPEDDDPRVRIQDAKKEPRGGRGRSRDHQSSSPYTILETILCSLPGDHDRHHARSTEKRGRHPHRSRDHRSWRPGTRPPSPSPPPRVPRRRTRLEGGPDNAGTARGTIDPGDCKVNPHRRVRRPECRGEQ